MRDINRIDPFLQKLGEYWKQHPDLRFGQIISNILGITRNKCQIDPFYYEEDDLLKLLKS